MTTESVCGQCDRGLGFLFLDHSSYSLDVIRSERFLKSQGMVVCAGICSSEPLAGLPAVVVHSAVQGCTINIGDCAYVSEVQHVSAL